MCWCCLWWCLKVYYSYPLIFYSETYLCCEWETQIQTSLCFEWDSLVVKMGFQVLKKVLRGHCPYFTGGSAVLVEIGGGWKWLFSGALQWTLYSAFPESCASVVKQGCLIAASSFWHEAAAGSGGHLYSFSLSYLLSIIYHFIYVWWQEAGVVVLGKVDSGCRQIVATDWFSNSQHDLSFQKGHLCNLLQEWQRLGGLNRMFWLFAL